MPPKSPPAGVAQKLVFGSGLEEEVVGTFPPTAAPSIGDVHGESEARVSMYVSLFEGMSLFLHMY